MICLRSACLEELEKLKHDVESTSEEFRHQIYQTKCKVTDLVHSQIQRLKDRKDDLYSTNSQVLMYYEHEKIDASTDPLIDDNSVNQGMKNLINDDGVDESNVYTETEGSNIHEITWNLEKQAVQPNVRSIAFTKLPRFSKTITKILSALAIGFFVWISLAYGALLAASMCGTRYCLPSMSSRRPTVF